MIAEGESYLLEVDDEVASDTDHQRGVVCGVIEKFKGLLPDDDAAGPAEGVLAPNEKPLPENGAWKRPRHQTSQAMRRSRR